MRRVALEIVHLVDDGLSRCWFSMFNDMRSSPMNSAALHPALERDVQARHVLPAAASKRHTGISMFASFCLGLLGYIKHHRLSLLPLFLD